MCVCMCVCVFKQDVGIRSKEGSRKFIGVHSQWSLIFQNTWDLENTNIPLSSSR